MPPPPDLPAESPSPLDPAEAPPLPPLCALVPVRYPDLATEPVVLHSCYSSLPTASYYNSIQRSISSHLLLMHIQLADDMAFDCGSNGFLSLSSTSQHAGAEAAKKKGGAEAAVMSRAVCA